VAITLHSAYQGREVSLL